MPLNVAILVGGRGKRIRAEKGLLELHGKKFVEIMLEKFGDCNTVLVCRDDEQKRLYEKFGKVIVDEVKDFGPLAGIYSALNYFKDFVLVVAVDMPLVRRELAEFIYKIARETNADAVIPTWRDGKKEPLLACYSFNAVKEIRKSIIAGERRVIKPMERLNVLYYSIEKLKVFDERLLSFINVNTKNDLEMVKCLLTDTAEL